MSIEAFCVTLPGRGLIHVEGADRVEFLQGLVSNDVEKLEEQHIQYACLLTPQGKYLHDFFLHHGDGFILIDCEGGERAKDLYHRLNRYRLRADVKLSVEEDNSVFAVFGNDEGLPDPRHAEMGRRSFEKPDLPEKSFDEWDMTRLKLGIPDGSRDMEVERSTMLECNLDKFNAVDWKKGCWMGQELTARMHYRNLGKKHLQALEFLDTAPPPPLSDLIIGDRLAGQMRTSCGPFALAMVKDEFLKEIQNGQDQIRLLGQ
jgi:folate-binding protein YgfZ